jgi:hypothetical protein
MLSDRIVADLVGRVSGKTVGDEAISYVSALSQKSDLLLLTRATGAPHRTYTSPTALNHIRRSPVWNLPTRAPGC